MSFLAKSSCIFLLGFIIFSIVIYLDDSAVVFESLESKTNKNKAIYNKIKWVSIGEKDIWLMQQSHNGLNKEYHNWDKVGIIIDKSKKPYESSFFQFKKESQIEWSESTKEIPYKVTCFSCHTNGLRVIRPNWESSLARQSIFNTLKIKLWNIKIKSYGRVVASEKDNYSFIEKKIPFRRPQKSLNKKINIKTCNMCHKESGFFARGELFTHNLGTIKFMIENEIMPPLGIKMSGKEKEAIKRLIN